MSLSTSRPVPIGWKPKYNPWIIAIAVMAGTFMEVLDTAVANVALPHIAGNLAVTPEEATWAITSYLVANAIVLPMTAWLGRRFGRKRFLLVCVCIFTLASLWTATAHSLTELILARVLQGLGGGALQPVSQAILLENFPPEKRGQAMAFWAVGVIVAPILGPIVGGWFTDNLSWRWSFLINLPVGFVAIAMIWIFIEDPPYLKAQRPTSVDGVGFMSLAVWISALQIMLDKGQMEDWFSSTFIVALLVIFILSLAFFLIWETRNSHPVVDLGILRDRNFGIAVWVAFLVGAVLYGSVTILPLFLQSLLGYPSFDAGLAVAPRGIGAMCAMFIVGPLLARFDGRYFIMAGFTLLGLSNFLFSRFTMEIGVHDIFFPNMLSGVAIGMIFVPLVTVANAFVPLEKLGNASGLFNLLRNLGGGVGIALCQTAISRGSQTHQALMTHNLDPYNWLVQQSLRTTQSGLLYREMVQQSAHLSYMDAFRTMGWLCWAVVPIILLLKKPPAGTKAAAGAH